MGASGEGEDSKRFLLLLESEDVLIHQVKNAVIIKAPAIAVLLLDQRLQLIKAPRLGKAMAEVKLAFTAEIGISSPPDKRGGSQAAEANRRYTSHRAKSSGRPQETGLARQGSAVAHHTDSPPYPLRSSWRSSAG